MLGAPSAALVVGVVDRLDILVGYATDWLGSSRSTDLESPVRRSSCESCLQDSVFRAARSGATAAADQVSTVVVSIGQIALASTMPMKPLYAGLITAAAIVGAILICVGCRRCYRTRDFDDGKARRYIPGITDEENALVDERYYHDRTSGQEGKEF